MADILNCQFRPNADAVESRVGEETVLLHLAKGSYYGLDEMGTRIWSALKEGRTPRHICSEVAQEFNVPAATVETDVREFLGDLRANDILVEL